MPKHISQQKRRKAKAAHPPPAEQIELALTERARLIAKAFGISDVQTHFAGYFNELGFRMDLPADFPEAQVVALCNRSLQELSAMASDLKSPFTWILGIYRDDRLVKVTGTGERKQWICATCATTHSSWHATCPYCGASPPQDPL